ncbi:MAG: hypothetical protein AB7J35_09025 [Dehalococcoidia bacterium]
MNTSARISFLLANAPAPEKVLIVHSNEEVARGLAILLRNEATLEVVASASNLQHGTHWARITQPDVIVLDSGIPGVSPSWAIDLLREAAPAARLVVLGERSQGCVSAFGTTPPDVDVIGAHDSLRKFLACLKRRPFRLAMADALFPRAAA